MFSKYSLFILVTIVGIFLGHTQPVPRVPGANNFQQFDWNKVSLGQAYATVRQGDTKDLSEVKGSAYYSSVFLPGYIYIKDTLQNYLYARYNAYADEVEIKKDLKETEVFALVKDREIMAQIKDDLLAYFPYFKNSKGQSDEGYLFVLEEGDSWTLLKRIRKKFKEGKKAQTSFEASFPDSFLEEKELYLIVDKSEPRYIKPTIKGITELVGDNNRGQIKDFVSENRLDLSNPRHLASLLTHLETASSQP